MSHALRLSRMHYPVTVLGYGMRIGIWTQGCSIGCKGCISRDTWGVDAGVGTSAREIVARCAEWVAGGEQFDGITISGGEPFDQPQSLLELLEAFNEWLGDQRSRIDLLCYSGYPHARLESEHRAILSKLDVLIPNPYVAARAPGAFWRGSSNQPLVCLTPLAEERYGASRSTEAPSEPEVQFVVDGGIWFIGVPRPGDMQKIEEKLLASGIELETVSWR